MGVSGTYSGMLSNVEATDTLPDFLALPRPDEGASRGLWRPLGLSPLLTGVAGGRSLSKCSGFSSGPNDTFFLLASEASSILQRCDTPAVINNDRFLAHIICQDNANVTCT